MNKEIAIQEKTITGDRRRKPFAKKAFAKICRVPEGTFLENLKRLERLVGDK